MGFLFFIFQNTGQPVKMATVSCPHDLCIDKLLSRADKERSCNLRENMKLRIKIKQVQQSPAKYSHEACTSEFSITEDWQGVTSKSAIHGLFSFYGLNQ